MQKFDGIQDLQVLEEGFLFGTFYRKGETIPLDYRRARDFLREGRLGLPASSKPAAKKKPATKED